MVRSLQYFSRSKDTEKRKWLEDEIRLIRTYAGKESIEQITARVNSFNAFRNITRKPHDVKCKGHAHGCSFKVKKDELPRT